MPPDVEPEILEKKVSGDRNVAISFVGLLDVGELLTGTPTILEVTTTDLTLTSKVVNTAQLTLSGKTVPVGEAIQFHVTGGTANTTYSILITTITDATPAQTLPLTIKLRVKAD